MKTFATAINVASYSGPILNQATTSGCVMYATAARMTHFMNMQGVTVPDLAPTYGYGLGRNLQGTFEVDTGLVPWVGLFSAKSYGMATAADWGNDPYNLYSWPDAAMREKAFNFRVADYIDYGVPADINATIKGALSHGNAPILSYFLPDGRGHAVMVVGADDATGLYTYQNSLGEGFGANGFGTLPYSYLTAATTMAVHVIDQISYNGVLYDNRWTEQTEQVSQLYNAILNRAPNHDGLMWWAAAVQSGASLIEVATGMLGSSEYAAIIPGDDTAAQTDAWLDMTLFGHSNASSQYVGGDKATYIVNALMNLADDARIDNRADISQLYAMATHGSDINVASVVLIGVTADPNTVQTAFSMLN